MDSSVEKEGSEDCRTKGVFGGPPLESCKHALILSHMDILNLTIEDRRNQVQTWKPNMCNMSRFQSIFRDGLVFIEREKKHVHFDSSTTFMDSCRSHVNRRDKHQRNNNNNNNNEDDDVSVLNDDRLGTGGRVGVGGRVDGERMSERVFKSSLELIACPNTI